MSAAVEHARRRRRARLGLMAGGVALFGLAVGLSLLALRDTVTFFYGPTEVAAGAVPPGQTFRLGGLVKAGSVNALGDGATRFAVTDGVADVAVSHTGILPDLFREGQGVVARGRMRPDGVFEAAEVLAKHDETYMPPEAVEAMRRAGTWRGAP